MHTLVVIRDIHATQMDEVAVKNNINILERSIPMPTRLKTNKSQKSRFSLLTLLATIAITLPIGVYFISQQNTNLTDQRSKAGWDNPYFQCGGGAISGCNPGYTCECIGGPSCTSTRCFPENSQEGQCSNQGGLLCPGGRGKDTYVCCRNGRTCNPRGLPGCR